MKKSLTFVVLLMVAALPGCGGGAPPENRPLLGAPPRAPETPEVKPSFSIGPHDKEGVRGVAISDDAKVVASNSPGLVRVWSGTDGKLLHEIKSAGAPSMCFIALSPDGKKLVHLDKANVALEVFDLESGKKEASFWTGGAIGYYPKDMSFSSKGDWLIFRLNDRIIGWDLKSEKGALTEKETFGWKATSGESVYALSNLFDKDRKIATGNKDGTIQIWSVPDGKLLTTLAGGHDMRVEEVAVSEDGKTLASTSLGAMKIWDVAAKKVTRSDEISPSPSQLRFLPDNKTLIYQLPDHEIIMENLESKERKRLVGHVWAAMSMALTRDGTVLASGDSKDGTIKLWTFTSAPAHPK